MSAKVGRNEPCPCGSGKKYKKCCGFNTSQESLFEDTAPHEAAPLDEPSLSQWQALYGAAGSIRLLAPWKYLWDSELVTLMLPDYEEPVYCSVMGRSGECYGIGIYPGYDSFIGYHRMATAPRHEPPFVSAFDQNCLMCYFGDREEVSPKERGIMKELGLRFRGRNEWIFFRSMEPGLYPWDITAMEAELMTQALQNLAMACMHLADEKLTVDFDGGETLLRVCSPEKDLWLNTAAKMPPIPVVISQVMVGNEILMAKLKAKKANGAALELEAAYLPTPMQDKKNERPYFPRLIVLMDRKSGMILDQHISGRDEDCETAILDMLAGYIEKHGRPTAIYVRDDRTGRYAEDFCAKANIKLVLGKGVPAVDYMLMGMMEAME